ncbi:helix-turn-helix domain-containing protein [Bradyrhizobium sp. NAS80.1]|uniref:helix-turn-helix domain-containing protein n=1 Tax=Bradyrhizobium sp. NAS80.1 TaxID=1680159 RepID=UPI000AB989A7
MIAQMVENDKAKPEPEPTTKLEALRRSGRSHRRSLYAEILDLRAAGLSPRGIAPRIGMSVRTVERWLAAGGEPEHRRPPAGSVLIDPFRDYLQSAGRKVNNTVCNCGPKSSSAALKAAERPCTGGLLRASRADRRLRRMCGGDCPRTAAVHGS